jgi:molecular chaperone HtpG
MKSFKAESKKVLNLMINSIYTHKEIFIREIISNASDAMDKLYYKSLTEGISGLSREDFKIKIEINKTDRILKISDNGIGMTEEELDNDLGTIARSGSQDFKAKVGNKEDIDIIGQFGVGFYSVFMVGKKVEVLSKTFGADKANKWTSEGDLGYEIEPAEKETNGTDITIYLKDNTDDEKYDEYLEEYEVRNLIKKYSDYIRYPIQLLTEKTVKDEESKNDKAEENTENKTENCCEHEHEGECCEHDHDKEEKTKTVTEWETVNSMVPLWKKQKTEITKEQYNSFYTEMFADYKEPLKVIHTSAEGAVEYKALLFIPAVAPYNYYSKNYEKGLRLYTNGVLITERCEELLPDYFSFIKGLVDCELSLNISRETIQHNRELKAIAANIEKKIKSELSTMLTGDRENYEKFWNIFGLQIKYGVYSDWGMHKDLLSDLLLFKTVKDDKYLTLDEYFKAMPADQKYIYYATGKSTAGIKALPQSEKVTEKGYDIICCTEDIDEFALKIINEYQKKEFKSVAADDTGIEEEKVEENKELTDYLKNVLKIR